MDHDQSGHNNNPHPTHPQNKRTKTSLLPPHTPPTPTNTQPDSASNPSEPRHLISTYILKTTTAQVVHTKACILRFTGNLTDMELRDFIETHINTDNPPRLNLESHEQMYTLRITHLSTEIPSVTLLTQLQEFCTRPQAINFDPPLYDHQGDPVRFITMTREDWQHTNDITNALGDRMEADMLEVEKSIFIGNEAMETFQELCQIIPRGNATFGPWYELTVTTLEADQHTIDPWVQNLAVTTPNPWWFRKSLPGIKADIYQLPLSDESCEELIEITNCLRML